jgi:hypothetical protein
LNEKICEESELDRLFFEKLDVSIIPNPTIMNQLKIRALMEYFESKMYGREGFSYDFTQGIYDADLIKISSKLKWWYDFPVHLGFSSLSLISRLHLI